MRASRQSPTAYPVCTIERVLEYGDEDAVAWLRQTFTQAQILEVLRTDRHLTPLSANFWALLFGVAARDVAAPAFTSRAARVWRCAWDEVKAFFTAEVPRLL